MDISRLKRIHFIGIGGSGMSALARILLEMGYRVSGSDLKETAHSIRLREMGATVFLRHSASNLRGAGVVVLSTAIPPDNPERQAAVQDSLPMYHRSEILEFIMAQYAKRIGVAGTHGKTTTTAMLARFLMMSKVDPTYVIGGELSDYGGNARMGQSEYFVGEVDESDGSLLNLTPNIGILTNVESEHMEYYRSLDRLKATFQEFMQGIVARDGYLVLNRDDDLLMSLAESFSGEQCVTYSIDSEASVRGQDLHYTKEGVSFTLWVDGQDLGQVDLQVYGRHNVYNALAVIALSLREGFTPDQAKKGLFNFMGSKRRFQFVGECDGVRIFDDYGHHPTEIETTLKGVKDSFNSRVICIFQPHRYSRTRDLLEVFPGALSHADIVVVSEVYSANEAKITGISGKRIVEGMPKDWQGVAKFVEKKSQIPSEILGDISEGDIVITMGAGDIHSVGKELLLQLRQQSDAA